MSVDFDYSKPHDAVLLLLEDLPHLWGQLERFKEIIALAKAHAARWSGETVVPLYLRHYPYGGMRQPHSFPIGNYPVDEAGMDELCKLIPEAELCAFRKRFEPMSKSNASVRNAVRKNDDKVVLPKAPSGPVVRAEIPADRVLPSLRFFLNPDARRQANELEKRLENIENTAKWNGGVRVMEREIFPKFDDEWSELGRLDAALGGELREALLAVGRHPRLHVDWHNLLYILRLGNPNDVRHACRKVHALVAYGCMQGNYCLPDDWDSKPLPTDPEIIRAGEMAYYRAAELEESIAHRPHR
ncbi:MAG: hypothetical protein ACT6QU_14655 [Aliihoeflea sp.]|uniref:hypothetical protein n=1 Tax=Aliihoeflea sp. TaxID=2608088 RepID=UPI004034359F